MPSNIEIKAHYDEERYEAIKCHLGVRVEKLVQMDTFFKCNTGRLKLRQETVNGTMSRSDLIGYNRSDDTGPSRSDFTRTNVPNANDVRRILENTLGIIGVVQKHRELYLVSDANSLLVSRVHIDDVKGLGRFLELEVNLDDDSDEAAGVKFAQELTDKFKIQQSDLISTAYMDMLKAKGMELDADN